jgi:hypothetical protein
MSIRVVTFSSLLYVMLFITFLVGCKSSNVLEPDPAFDEAIRAQDSNVQRFRRIMDAYIIVQRERVKAGEISRERAVALNRLKLEELLADMEKANREIADNYKRSHSSGRSFTCVTTTSFSSAFTRCD